MTAVSPSGKYPYHLIAVSGSGSTVYGWVDAADVQAIASSEIAVGDVVQFAGGLQLHQRERQQLQQQIDDEALSKYMDMAADAVAQAVTYTAQTFTDALKAEGKFTKERQIEAFNKAKDKTLEILGETAVEALGEIYGDFDAWLETKIEQTCREIKTPEADKTAATTAAATAASVATTIATTAVQQLAAEAVPAAAEVQDTETE